MCRTCQTVEVIEPRKHGLAYDFAQHVVSLPGRDGFSYPITQPMIPKMRNPRGGWSVEIFIHGQKSIISGTTAYGVFQLAKQFLDLNEVLYTVPQLWLNLNIQWVERANPKYQMIHLDDLLAIATPNY